MAIYADRPDLLVEGEWHFCEEDADVLPFAHAFGSSNFDAHGTLFDERLGEKKEFHPWRNGAGSARFNGKHFCGTAEQWLHGGLYADRLTMERDEDGFPLCCPGAAYDFSYSAAYDSLTFATG